MSLTMPKQQGFTLVELMVSMVIGLFLIGGVVAVFVANSQSYRFQQALADVQEGGEFAMAQIVNDIRMSGFGLDNDTLLEAFVNGQPSFPDSYASGAQTNFTEVLQFRYQDVGDRDNDNDRNEVVTRGYFIRQVGGRSTLMVNDSVANTTVALLDGVEGIRFTYLVDNTGNDRVVDVAKTLRGVGVNAMTNSDWDDTVGIRLQILVSSPQRQVLDTSQTLPAVFNSLSLEGDRYHQVFTSTVEMRNRVR